MIPRRHNKRHKSTKMIPSTLICPKCKSKFIVFRSAGRMREQNHKKWLWCYKCKRKYNFIEVRELYEEVV